MDQVQGKQVNPDFKDQTLYAKVKHFRIQHPTFPELTLTHSCLEGPENAVYCRGYAKQTRYAGFPHYWEDLVHLESITVQVTPAGAWHNLYVVGVEPDGFSVDGADCPSFFWVAYGTRKDLPRLQVAAAKEEEPTVKAGSRLQKWCAMFWQIVYWLHL